MLRYLLLGLCLIPVTTQAETACLEGPQDGNCHTVDINGEVFKTATPTAAVAPKMAASEQVTATTKQRRINTQLPASTNKTAQNKVPRHISVAEQRIRQRAQTVESRFMSHQGISNLPQLDNNDSYAKRKQQSAELRRRIEN